MNTKGKIALGVAAVALFTVAGVVIVKRIKKGKTITTVTDSSGNTVKLTSIQSAIISEASRYVGAKEIKENKGWDNKDLQDKMAKYGGWQPGWAYCVAFVKMVLHNVSSGNAQAFLDKKVTVNCMTTWKNLTSAKNDYTEVISKPEPGCLVCYEGHTEICESTNGKVNTVITANSYFPNSKEEGVVRKQRTAGAALDKDPFLGYIRIKKLN